MKEKEIWYRQLGFAGNPFSIKPAIYNDGLYGYPHVISEVVKCVESGKIAFIRGDYGNGKSTLLKQLLRKFGGQGRLAYFSCNRLGHSLDVKRILNGRYGFIGKLFDIKPKRMMLLLDEAQFLTRQDFQSVMGYYDSGHLKSIVFVAKEQMTHFMPDRMQRITSIFALGQVGQDDAVSIVRRRIGRLPLLSDDIISEVFRRSQNNVRVFLKNCDMLCRYAVGRGMDKVTMDIVDMLPSSRAAVKEEIEEPVKEVIKEEPEVSAAVEKEADEILEAAPAILEPAKEAAAESAEIDKKPKQFSAEELYY